jgi:hypothetical protein
MYGHPEFDLFEAIYNTRAMRRLKPDPVPREMIMKIIEAATLSPSNSNRQPWIFGGDGAGNQTLRCGTLQKGLGHILLHIREAPCDGGEAGHA